MMRTSSPPVALVTGSAGGFGRLTCLALAKNGFRVIATMRSLENATPLERAAKQAGCTGEIACVQLDVTEEAQVRRVVAETVEQHGTIDVLVNNAGYARGGFAEEVPLAEWRRQFDTNFFGAVAVTQAVLPHMRSRRSGTIINVSSVSGRIGFPALGPYAASKFALEGFSESLRLELKPFGIRVVLVEPGAYRTDIWSKGLADVQSPPDSPYRPLLDRLRRRIERSVQSAGDPREVAELIAAIATHPSPGLRYPVGKGVKSAICLKEWLPWNWVERLVAGSLSAPGDQQPQ